MKPNIFVMIEVGFESSHCLKFSFFQKQEKQVADFNIFHPVIVLLNKQSSI